jgi:hypothetical protein
MKIKPEHYAYMRDAMARVLKDNQGISAASYAAQGLTDRRFRWDLFWAAKLSQWVSDNVYKYANDAHLDTALRAIVKELGVS